jgi:hypothetical protein
VRECGDLPIVVHFKGNISQETKETCTYVPLGLRPVSVKRNINTILSVFDYSHARKMSVIKTTINHTIHTVRLNKYVS